MTKRLPRLLVVFIIVLGAIGVYMIFRLRLFGESTPLLTEESQIKEAVRQPGNPIRKAVKPDGSKVKYDILGSFVGEIQPSGRVLDNAYIGEFAVKGDPLNRRIPVILGRDTEKVSFGIYEGEFVGKSRWRSISADEVKQELKSGETVQIIINYSIPKLSNRLSETQVVLDTLMSEFNSGQFSYEIPGDISPLDIFGVAVVR